MTTLKRSLPMVAVVDVRDMRVDSAWYTWPEAKDRARRIVRMTPVEIMLLVRDDSGSVIGVQELTRAEKRECGSWRPQFRMRPEDVVNRRHRLDPVEPRSSIAADAEGVEADRAVHA